MCSKLILIHASSSAETISHEFSGKRWIYFGTDYLKRKRWEDAVGVSSAIHYKPLLLEVSYSLRDSYIEWASGLGKEFWDRWEWWISPLANRSNLTSPLYLYVCYIEVLKLLVEKEPSPIVVISESREFLDVINDNFRNQIEIVTPHKVYAVIERFVSQVDHAVRFLASWGFFFLRSFTEWIIARLTKTPGNPKRHVFEDKHHILIHTCVDDVCMGEDGIFRDRYFAGLADYLKQHGKRVSTLIWLANVRKMGRAKAIKWFRKNKDSFLIPQDYYNPLDCMTSFAAVLRSARVPVKNTCYFKGWNLLLLVRKEQKMQQRNSGAAYFANYIPMFRKMRDCGIVIDIYLDFWELKMCEVPGIIGIKKNYPGAKIIAYQHAALLPKLLFANYKTTAAEFDASPHPDIGIANSKLNARELVNNGFPEDYVKIGPAFRYNYLKDVNRVFGTDPADIVVFLPMVLNSAYELLEKIYLATMNTQGVTLKIKPHPMTSLGNIKKKLSFKWPDNFVVISGSMMDALKNAALVLTNDGSAMVEAVYCGVKTVVVSKDTDFDIVPLDILDDNSGWIFVSTVDELMEVINEKSIRPDSKGNRIKDMFEFEMSKLDAVFN